MGWRHNAKSAMPKTTTSEPRIATNQTQVRGWRSIPLLASSINVRPRESLAIWTRAECAGSKPCSATGRSAAKVGVDDGTRTHDGRNHNPGLYQLSYVHHCAGAPGRTRTCDPRLRRPMLYPAELRARSRSNNNRRVGVRPRCPGQSGRGERIRTSDPLLPKQMRYQTAPRPE